MPARTFGEPVADQLNLVRAVVVHDHMHIEIGRYIAFDLVEEFAELLRAMPGHAFADNGSGLHIERGKQRYRAMPLVIMRAPFSLARVPPVKAALRRVLDTALVMAVGHDGS